MADVLLSREAGRDEFISVQGEDDEIESHAVDESGCEDGVLSVGDDAGTDLGIPYCGQEDSWKFSC